VKNIYLLSNLSERILIDYAIEPLLFSKLLELPFPPNNMCTEEDDWDNLSDVRLDFHDEQSISLGTCCNAYLRIEDCFQY
jgi:hypothetical protein